ncbi:3,4-dihydroxy-2-butanone-4-phosphate synthase [Cupriavidus pinatubonensis]|uniref:3,4-dihydroxy-2-butanone-4-phosphate synthase n=1 Tax=Cupriavidus pinatubonensis TaxID=248026 RepID=UPI00112A32CD|nr:3,4-dihydroxy-2-butanone-4-phosphate synthase [Cupriavidus pinatubonensis]TPQ37979.1 hypothetical protein C2U69_15080 [Cupriavidus pinatubonensis]
MHLENVDAALSTFSSGGPVIVTDDHDREDEGDLIMAASHCSAKKMAFIIRHTSGIVCAPQTQRKAHILRIDPMSEKNEDNHQTAIAVSIDARSGMTIGNSAQQRANRVTTLALSNDPHDLVRPGHVFPLIAKSGVVFERAGLIKQVLRELGWAAGAGVGGRGTPEEQVSAVEMEAELELQ